MKPLELAKKMDVSEGYLSQIINSSDEKINKNQKRKLEIAEHLKIEPAQLDTNPMQVFNFMNCNIDGSNNVNSVQNAYLSDPEILLKLKSYKTDLLIFHHFYVMKLISIFLYQLR
ncbi:MAG: hypothetical protein ACOYLO_07400 [Ferruginibacter sp.]